MIPFVLIILGLLLIALAGWFLFTDRFQRNRFHYGLLITAVGVSGGAMIGIGLSLILKTS